MSKKLSIRNLYLRTFLVMGWIFIIFAVLYWPALNQKSLSKSNECIHILTWGGVFDNKTLQDFETQTGIKLQLSYYNSNEELLVKLKATQGRGYDLIVPSDYAIKILSQEGLLKKIDKKKFPFFKKIDPFLLGHDFDPQNDFSLPFQWDVGGFGIDSEYFGTLNPRFSWDLLFNKNVIHYKVAMSNDPVEAIDLASYFLFGAKQSLNPTELQRVRHLLLEQKSWVEAYVGVRADYLIATKNSPLAFSLSSFILRSSEEFPFVRFVVPERGTFISIENIAIPIQSDKEDQIYEFLNYLYQPEIMSHLSNQYCVFPATLDSITALKFEKEYRAITEKIKSKGYDVQFFRYLISESEAKNLWVDIKS